MSRPESHHGGRLRSTLRTSAVATALLLVGTSALLGGGPAAAAAASLTAPVVAPTTAPTVPVMIVLDASGSVNSSHAVENVRDAGRSFLDALQDTNSTARVIQFATVSQELTGRGLIDADSMASGGALGRLPPESQRGKAPSARAGT